MRLHAVLPLALLTTCLVAGSSVMAGDALLTPGFKVSIGNVAGGVQDATHKNLHFGLAIQCDYALHEHDAITGELGYRWIPGDQYLAATFVRTGAHPGGYQPGITYRAMIQKPDGEGFEAGLSYRRNIFTPAFFVRAGLRIGFYKVQESNAGTAYLADQNGILNSATTIATTTTKKTVSPGIVLGLGYHMAPNHVVEVDVVTLRLASDSVKVKNGFAVEASYCMRF